MTDQIKVEVHVDLEALQDSRFTASSKVQQLGDILSPEDVDALIANFDQKEADQVLMAGFGSQYAASGPYVEGIAKVVTRQDDPELPLTRAEQELIIITLLTSQRLPMELSLHIYLGIAHGYSAEMIGEVMMFTGIYGGISSFAEGLFTAEKTLLALKAMVDENKPLDPATVLTGLIGLFNG
ncbi:MAG: carboxymuconolactone decarboxylase family protein [Pseudomonadota bacterium]